MSNMVKKGNLWLPGDKDYDKRPLFPWEKLRSFLGLPLKQKGDNQYDIYGYFVKDTRVDPPIAIFKNCSFPLKAGTQPQIDDTPQPFQSVGEAYSYIKSLNLSMEEEGQHKLCALAEDPGMGNPAPNIMFVTKDELKK